jgi:hypothetical protein
LKSEAVSFRILVVARCELPYSEGDFPGFEFSKIEQVDSSKKLVTKISVGKSLINLDQLGCVDKIAECVSLFGEIRSNKYIIRRVVNIDIPNRMGFAFSATREFMELLINARFDFCFEVYQ